jgi:hypothetical protein
MGEMADYYVERAFDSWFGSELDDAYPPDIAVKCRHCGKRCTWHHTGVRWALFDAKGDLHDCRATPASADEFSEC